MIILRRAFTLVELLVVIAILAILVGLMLVAIPQAIFAAKRAATGQRLENILAALQLYGQGSGQSPYLIMRYGLRTPLISDDGTIDPLKTMGDDLQWQPLRSVAVSVWGGKSSAPMIADRKGIIPNTAFTQTASVLSYGFRSSDWTWYMDDDAPAGCANKIASLRTYDRSQLGENWDTTQEVMPVGVTGAPKTKWFRARWPRVWPVSDWDQASPGRVPVRWDSPWGRARIDPQNLTPTAPAARSLDQLSPLDSIRLLQIAGILPAGAQGEAAYRQERSADKPWNDRWGNPLVLVSAVFLPPRSEVCENRILPKTGEGYSSSRLALLGLPSSFGEGTPWPYVGGNPRDALLSRYSEAGFSRAVYVAVGAPGPKVRDALPSPWTAVQDPVVLRNLWLQVREVCKASEWNENALVAPPWNGSRLGKLGGMRSMLSAPFEIR